LRGRRVEGFFFFGFPRARTTVASADERVGKEERKEEMCARGRGDR
jgi:hypothetical protein